MPNTVIALKKSSTPSAVPSNLANGELAINYADGKLFYKNTAGYIAEISGSGNNTPVSGDNFGTINASGTLIVADTTNDVLTFIAGDNIAITGDAINDTITISATGVITPADIGPAFDKANSANIIASLAYDKANAANVLAFNTGLGANAFAAATIAGANTAVGTGANAFTSATIAGANTAVGTGANNYSNSAFVKLTAPNQTITGDLAIAGNLVLSGNTVFANVSTLRIDDPLLYLAGNNYTSDIVDIGFIANYVNSTGQNVHTGLFREHSNKRYYLFQEYNQEPVNNHIDPTANGFTLAVLNADLITSNLVLGGANLITTLSGTNTAIGAGANAFASATIAGANSYLISIIAGANTAVGTGANNYLLAVIAGANTAVGAGANNYMIAVQNGSNTAVGAGANAFASATIAGANNYMTATVAGANTAVGAGANAFTSATIAGANTAVGTGANNYLLSVIAGANTAVGTGANNYMIAVQNGSNTAVGGGANAFTSATISGANSYLISIIAGANTAVGAGANAFAAATVSGANTIAIAAFNAANAAGGGPAFDKANAANIIASLAYDKANAANVLAFNTGIGANSWSNTKLSNSTVTLAGSLTATGNVIVLGNNYFGHANATGTLKFYTYYNVTSNSVDTIFNG